MTRFVPTTRGATTAETAYTIGRRQRAWRRGFPAEKLSAKWRNVPDVRLIPTHWRRIQGPRESSDAAGANRTTASPRSHIANATIRRTKGSRVGVRGTRATMYATRAAVAMRLAALAKPHGFIGPSD